jgi:hypothetical protein
MTDDNFNVGLARQFAELQRRKGEVKAELDDIDRKLERLQPQLLEEFSKTGIPRIPVDGYTVYLHRDLRARVPEGASKEEACEALKAAGHGIYVEPGFNHNSVSALFRELDKNGEEIPSELKGKLEPVEIFTVRARRGRS